MNEYTLNVKIANNKAGKFHYAITDQFGIVLSERKSNRKYVAATINGQFYFGRFDLVGKGEHGRQVKYMQEYGKEPVAVAYMNEEGLKLIEIGAK
jgi:hypothetical protein